ncbi:aminodeoxychorismate lyase [Vibrio sp.]|uniref:aminodeoxychorismate lyase n=1 Tax=Vibrio sp. TaxID=678 RepID=UPI003AA8D662
MFFVNGKQQQSVSITDRSFQYGDGCFTTILVKYGQPLLLCAHKERIDFTCQKLFMSPPEWNQVEEWIEAAINASGHQTLALSGLKIHVSRGSGGRGYSPSGANSIQVVVQTFAYPEHYSIWQSEGIKVGVSATRLGINPQLAGLKHNNRLEQVLIKKEIDDTEYDDNIVLDIDGNVIEMSAANLFWVSNNQLYTPELVKNGVLGIKRKQVCEYAEQKKMIMNIGSYMLDDVLNADEVFITNALHGVVPIIQINNKEFNIGVITRAIQEKINP